MNTVRERVRSFPYQKAIPERTTTTYKDAQISLDMFDPLGFEMLSRRLDGEDTNYIRRVTLDIARGPIEKLVIYQKELFINPKEKYFSASSRKTDEYRQKRLRKLLEFLYKGDASKVLTVDIEPQNAGGWPADFKSVSEAIFNDSRMSFKFLGLHKGSNINDFEIKLFAFTDKSAVRQPNTCDKTALVTITAKAITPVPIDTVQSSLWNFKRL